MRSPLLFLIAGLLLVAGCGSNGESSSAAGPASSTLTQPEQRFVTAITAAVPGAPGRWSNATLVRHGYAACTALNADADNPEAAVAAVGTDVDDATARVIVGTAAAELCPAASAAGLSPTAPPATPTAQPDETGRPFANGGITVTVKKASTTDTIEMNESNFRPGSGYERYTKTKSGGDAKFVVVETHVVNNAKTSLDLTCSLPINTRLLDEQQRNFEPIEDLYKLKGNPECNKQLQPGFESDMTWVYRVPVGANVAGWAFQDTTDYAAPPGGFTVVHLQA